MIRFENVTKRYRGTSRPALSEVDFEVLRGEFVFLVGASGSGKSSCLRMILREETPSDGRVVVLGRDMRSLSNRRVPYFRRHIGAVFQDFRLLPNKTVFQNVAFTLQVIGSSSGFIRQAVPEVLALVGLDGKEKRFPHELSGGEQQRVAIARALANRPQVLLADEPTGNLDPGTSVDIMQLLARINANGTTVLMATHEAGFVDQMQRRVIELSDGVLVRDERHGGYGDTSGLPSLAPEPEKGAAAIAALTAVLEVAREVNAGQVEPEAVDAAVSAAEEAVGTVLHEAENADAAAKAAALAAAIGAPSVSAGAQSAGAPSAQPARANGSIPQTSAPVTASEARAAAAVERPAAAETAAAATTTGAVTAAQPAAAASVPADLPPATTQSLPVIDAAELDVTELGVADRLGLGEGEPDEEVGPTS